MRTITREEYERIPKFRKSMEYDLIQDWSHRPERKHWVNVRIGNQFAACDPKYLPEENKMREMTVAEFEAIPREWRTTRCKSPIPGVGGWVAVRITDEESGLPFAAIFNGTPGLTPPQEITIAVWADGTFCPITVSPEEHVKEIHDGCGMPVRYETWTRHEECYSRKSTRRVEMLPVVLPC